MKTLVIHPKDSSTDFLSDIYSDKKYWKILRTHLSYVYLKEQIKFHDRIVMMGHGTPYGLLGYDGYVINANFVELLKDKQCVFIWCNADMFVEEHNLTGFYTGMIISEYGEALYCDVKANNGDIEESNKLFASSIKNGFDSDVVKYS